MSHWGASVGESGVSSNDFIPYRLLLVLTEENKEEEGSEGGRLFTQWGKKKACYVLFSVCVWMGVCHFLMFMSPGHITEMLTHHYFSKIDHVTLQ